MPRRSGVVTLAVATAVLALLVNACGVVDSDGDKSAKKTTITFWHPWGANATELRAIGDNVAAFEEKHPEIRVRMVARVEDGRIDKALRKGGAQSPDVIASLSADNLGQFCATDSLVDLGPYLFKSAIIPEESFPPAMQEYTQFEGTQCALPLLGDAYGLYYNKDAFREAGIKEPPQTLSEFNQVAKKLTRSNAAGDSYEQLGFMPDFDNYETSVEHYMGQWNPAYFDSVGNSFTARDSSFTQMFEWQKVLTDLLGGYPKLKRYRATFGDEWGDENAFHTGKVVMMLDGEWRIGMLKDAKVPFDFGVAPFPVPDSQLDTYGKGFLSGSIIGIPEASKEKDAAWELVRYLTTDTDALVRFANAIHNVPSTLDALRSHKLKLDKRFQTFVDIALHPDSNGVPPVINGAAYLETLKNLGVAYDSGKQPNLAAGLRKADEEIDRDLARAR